MKKKVLSLMLAFSMVLGLAACGGQDGESSAEGSSPASGENNPGSEQDGNDPAVSADTYTFHDYATALATNWNPHTWETSADDAVLTEYLSSPFVTMQIDDSENGVYQWVYEMATSIEDVTADHQDDLTKYAVELPEGQTAEETTSGYVFEIKLNPNAKWEDGTPINADSYIYSMQQLLNPDMKNYRANLYYAGESAVAGGSAYYYQGASSFVSFESQGFTYDDFIANGGTDDEVYVDIDGFWGIQTDDGATFAAITDDTMIRDPAVAEGEDEAYVSAKYLWDNYLAPGQLYAEYGYDVTYTGTLKSYEDNVDYDSTVGCYKVDDYTIRYVNQYQIDFNYFLTSCTSNWLVYEDLYEAGKDTTGSLVTTDYGTSVDTTMSYGPYKLQSLQTDRQMVMVQNENWYGYEKQEDGSLVSYTPYLVDGESVQRYQTTSVVIDVMDDAAAKQAFLKGELSAWSPQAEDLLTYATSDQLYKVDETYTMSFFFNCGLDNLKEMDNSKGNQNSVVLSNVNFRKAMSLAIDREEYVTATAGYKPAYSLLNSLYFYDVYNDPTSSYRNSDEAMQAICNLYEVEYGAGTPYATLKDAYNSINGYNLTEAQALMKTACDELVEAGLYTAGDSIYIRMGWKAGALDSADNQLVELMNKYLNAAAEGSGFGTITLEAVGNLTDRYGDVASGEYAIGYGAWGGAAFYPFRNLQVYCDTEQYNIHEAGCWDPSVTNLTLNVKGEDVTMTWQDWSRALVGNGPYANEGFDVKLDVLSQMEEDYLKLYYRIPLASTTACSMLAYQCSYYTEDYNIMYGFGGLELMSYNYTDAEWTEFVSSQGGTLNYE